MPLPRRERLLPASGQSLLDGLDENSHKHTFRVSEDLKHALRECIELIGFDAVRHLREVAKERIYERPDSAGAQAGAGSPALHVPPAVPVLPRGPPHLKNYTPLNAEPYRPAPTATLLRLGTPALWNARKQLWNVP